MPAVNTNRAAVAAARRRDRSRRSEPLQPLQPSGHVLPGAPTQATVPLSWSTQMLTEQTHHE